MRPGGWPAVGTLVTVTAVTALAAVPLEVHASGVPDVANHPAVVLPMAAAAATVLLVAPRLDHTAHRRTRRLLVAAGLASVAYLAVTAALAWYGGRGGARDLVTEVLVAAQGVGWVPPITLLALAFLAALAEIGVAGRAARLLGRGIALWTTAVLPFAAVTAPPAPDSPYADLPPLWDEPVLSVLVSVLFVPWMVAVFLVPVVAWRAVGRANAAVRSRALAVALSTMAPPVTIVFCLAVTVLAYVADLLSAATGAAGLAVAYNLPFVLAAPLLVHALQGQVQRLDPRRATTALTIAVGTPLLIVAVTLAWLLADRLGGQGFALVVLATLVIGAVAATARRRLVRALLMRVEPVRARAAQALLAADRRGHQARELERVVRAALRDPHAVVSVQLPDGSWQYPDGRPAPRPARPVAAAAAHVDPPTSDATAALEEVADLVDRASLELAVRAQETAARAAAARADEAATLERKRLERDLHDGVQGRLLALALDLRVAQRGLPGGEAQLVLADAVESLGKAIDELRALSQGTGSDVLARRGLRSALVEFTGRMPLPVVLVRSPDRLDPSVESVIYLAVCEAVTNAVKHASASGIEIEVVADGGTALVTVADDGVGGADLRAGTGIRGLAERVAAAGGRLVVSDREPHGTLLEVTLPCGS